MCTVITLYIDFFFTLTFLQLLFLLRSNLLNVWISMWNFLITLPNLYNHHQIVHSIVCFCSWNQIIITPVDGFPPLISSVDFALQLIPPRDPYRRSSLYSYGWKPTPQTTPPVRYSIRPWYILMLFSGHLTSQCRRARGWRKTVNHGAVERAGAITDYHTDFRWG